MNPSRKSIKENLLQAEVKYKAMHSERRIKLRGENK